jgi:hypothetical protein
MARIAIDPIRRWRNAPVQREVDSRRVLAVWKVVLGVAVAVAPFAVYLLQFMSYVQTEYAIGALRSQQARLLEQERRLSIHKAALESLPVVERRAATELGLEHPPASHVLVVSSSDLPGARSDRPGVTPPAAR